VCVVLLLLFSLLEFGVAWAWLPVSYFVFCILARRGPEYRVAQGKAWAWAMHGREEVGGAW